MSELLMIDTPIKTIDPLDLTELLGVEVRRTGSNVQRSGYDGQIDFRSLLPPPPLEPLLLPEVTLRFNFNFL